MRNTGKLIIIPLLVLSLLNGLACSGQDESATPQRSFLWQVTSGSGTVYLLGSIHLATPDLYPLADQIENAFDECPDIAVEFDITTVDEAHLTRLMMQKGMYPQGDALYRNIPRDLYEDADELLEEVGADIFLFNSFEPWVVALEIESLLVMSYGYTGENGVDLYFLNRAHSEGKEIHELESAEYQINLLDGLPEHLQVILLEETVTHPPTRENLDDMFQAWTNGDVEAFRSLADDHSTENDDLVQLYQLIDDERNILMTEKIEGFLQGNECCFVVVGAAHLAGSNSIVEILQDKGYSVTQL